MRPSILALVALLCISLPPAAGHAAPAATVDLSPAPDGAVPLTPDGQIPLILEARPPYTGLAARIAALGGRVEHAFEHIDALAVTVPAEQVPALLADSQVLAATRQKLVRRAVAPVEIPGLGRLDEEAMRDALRDVAGRIQVSERGGGGSGLATFLGYDLVTGASAVWEDAGFGEGATVVVVDTGIFPGHPLLAGSVAGGLNLVPAEEEERIDANRDGAPDGLAFDWDAIQNHYHGTAVGSLIAGHGELLLPAASRLARSLAIHSPESVEPVDSLTVRVRLMGTAPAATLYAIKVFPYDGGESPDARVAAALDEVIRMKRAGELDADVINMSLGGPALDDGRTVLDRMVDAAVAEGITVVVAAGNEGPAVMTSSTPASAFRALAVGAAVDPLHTRVAIEQLFPQAPPGFGSLAYPHELQIASFSGRGPTADGRIRPDLVATGFLNYTATLVDTDRDGVNDAPGFGFGAGTSFSTPTVAGAAALLVAYGREIGAPARPAEIQAVLMRAAVPLAPFARLSEMEQGKGFLRLPEAFALLAGGRTRAPSRSAANRATAWRNLGEHGVASGASPALLPGETFSFVVRVPPSVSRIDFVFPEVTLSGNQNPVVGDQLGLLIHSAKRGGNGDYVFRVARLDPDTTFTYAFPEPGEIRVTFAAAFTNYGPVSGRFAARAASGPVPVDRFLSGTIGRDGVWEAALPVPAGKAAMGLALAWGHDWRTVPTYDLDLYLRDPKGAPHLEGVSLRSPELILVPTPAAGEWGIRVVDAGTVTGREYFRLAVKFYDTPPEGARELIAAVTSGAGVAKPGPSGAPAAVGPAALELLAATPNPFNPATTIRFGLGEPGGRVAVRIFDAGGRVVRVLADRVLPAGTHAVVWDGRNDGGQPVASGVYFYHVEAPAGRAVRKLVLAR